MPSAEWHPWSSPASVLLQRSQGQEVSHWEACDRAVQMTKGEKNVKGSMHYLMYFIIINIINNILQF